MIASRETVRPGVVLKVGGSLLDWDGLPEALPRLVASTLRQFGPPVAIVGGGKIVDEIRRLDQIHQLAVSPTHELAIRALGLTARLLPLLVPKLPWTLVGSHAELAGALAQNRVPVLTPWSWLEREDLHLEQIPLPHGWDTTSDSIAVHLAVRLGVQRVLLIKSTSPPVPADLPSAVACGLVDPVVPSQCDGLPALGVCNLRHDPDAITWLLR